MPGFGRRFAHGGLGRHRGQRFDGLAIQHAGQLIETGDGKTRVIRPLVDGQHVLHPGYKGGGQLGRFDGEGMVLLDVRSADEYRQGHLPQTVSMPYAELLGRLEELPRTGTIVAYCRGPFCVFANEAVQLLTAHGYPAVRLEEGFPDWKYCDLPYEVA